MDNLRLIDHTLRRSVRTLLDPCPCMLLSPSVLALPAPAPAPALLWYRLNAHHMIVTGGISMYVNVWIMWISLWITIIWVGGDGVSTRTLKHVAHA